MSSALENTTVFLNGRFVSRDEAVLSAFDAGVQHAVGLFETMTVSLGVGGEPRIPRLWHHLDRLADSAHALGLTTKLRREALSDAIFETCRQSGVLDEPGSRARVRLTVTGGDLSLLQSSAKSQVDPTILIVVQPPTAYPDEMFTNGVRVSIADLKVNPLNPFEGHKTLNYWPRLRALQLASARQASETLVMQVSNHLAGGAVSNAFVVHEDRLITPIAQGEEEMVGGKGALPSPVLPGVTRAGVIEWAHAEGIEVERRMVTIEDVLDAHELFLTNSSWGVLPVGMVEKEAINEAHVGPLTKRAVAWWREQMEETA
ncbi:MAG: aminotransferase class IV [Planctomycetota bacterium]